MVKIESRLERVVRDAISDAGLSSDGPLVVAVSGGPDSLALLYAVYRQSNALGLRLHGAHLNHGLRGAESDLDADFVAETFRSLGLEFSVEKADVAAFRRRRKLSMEEAARAVRYAFLERIATDQGTEAVALGHTADDQAETVLMHIIRGSGLTGLRGMEPVSHLTVDGQRLVQFRPLLRVSRKETEAYCRALGLQPRQDASNLSKELSRNRVRLELLPALEQYNPAIRQALIRLSESAALDLSYLESQVDRAWEKVVSHTDEGVSLDRDALSRLPEAIQVYLLRRAVHEVKGDLQDLERYHIDTMVHLLAGPAGKDLDLPSGMRFSVTYKTATLGPTPAQTGEAQRPLEDHPLEVPGQTAIPGWRVDASPIDLKSRNTASNTHGVDAADMHGSHAEQPAIDGQETARFDVNALGEPLSVRCRRPGDRFQPLGMSGTKKLQDFMVDAKVPKGQRDAIPLVVSPKGIAWVVGYRVAEWARVIEGTHRIVELRFTRC